MSVKFLQTLIHWKKRVSSITMNLNVLERDTYRLISLESNCF